MKRKLLSFTLCTLALTVAINTTANAEVKNVGGQKLVITPYAADTYQINIGAYSSHLKDGYGDPELRLEITKGGNTVSDDKFLQETEMIINGTNYGKMSDFNFSKSPYSGFTLSGKDDFDKIKKECRTDNLNIVLKQKGKEILNFNLENKIDKAQREEWFGKTSTPTPAVINKKPLEDAITKAKALDKTNKTDDSIKKLNDEIKIAEALKDKAGVTQDEINAEAEKLGKIKLVDKPAVVTPVDKYTIEANLIKEIKKLNITLKKNEKALTPDEIKKIIDNDDITLNGNSYKLSDLSPTVISSGISISADKIPNELKGDKIVVKYKDSKSVEIKNILKETTTTPIYSVSDSSSLGLKDDTPKFILAIGKNKLDIDYTESDEFLNKTKIEINGTSFGTMKEAGFYFGQDGFYVSGVNSLKKFKAIIKDNKLKVKLTTDGQTYETTIINELTDEKIKEITGEKKKEEPKKPVVDPTVPKKITPTVSIDGFKLDPSSYSTKVEKNLLKIGITDIKRGSYLNEERQGEFEKVASLEVNGKDYGLLKDVASFKFGTYTVKADVWAKIIKEQGGFDKITTIKVVKKASAVEPVKPDKPVVKVDKKPLETAIADAKKAETTKGKTDESVAEYKKAIEEAQKVYDNKNATKEEVAQAVKDLENAKKLLKDKPVVSNVDKTDLEKAIKKAEAVDTKGKTDETIAELQKAIAEAKKIDSKTDATEKEVKEAKENLQKAIDGLVDIVIDKTELKATIEKIEKLNEKDYTVESYKNLKEKLAEAKAIMSKEDVTQDEIDEAREELEEAFNALKEVFIDLKGEYGKYADAFVYTNKTIVDRAGEDTYFNVKGGYLSVLERAGRAAERKNKKDRRVDHIIGGIQVGMSKQLDVNKNYRVGAFVEFDNELANHYMIGTTLKYKDSFKGFARYRLANYEGVKNHNIDLYGNYAKRYELSTNSYFEPSVGLYLTYSGETKLSDKVRLESRFGYLVDASVKAAKRYDEGLEVYVKPEVRAGNNDQKLYQVGTSNSAKIKKSEFRGSVELGVSKVYENGLTPMMNVRVKTDKQKEVGVDVRLGASYKF